MGAESEARRRLEAFASSVQRTGVDSAPLLDPAAAEIFAAIGRAGADALLLKGAGLARLLYRPPERRSYADVDLLVPPSHLRLVEDALSGLGYHNATAPLGIDDVGGVVHADTWVGIPSGASQHVVVELHRWLPGAGADPEHAWQALWEGRTDIELAGCTIPVPDRPGQALGLATHAAQHGPGFLKGLAELRLALDRWPREVWERAAELAATVGALEAFAAGLRLTDEGAALATRLALPPNPAIDWEIRNAAGRPRGTFHVDAWRQATSSGQRIALLRKALFPRRRWIESEYRWAERGGPALVAAYVLHMTRAPLWAARALWFRRRAKRGA